MTTNLPRLELPSAELAAWLDKQGSDVWWFVDGDPLLTGNVSFPCTGDVLAAELRRLNQPLLVVPPENSQPGDRHLTSDDLDDLVYKEEGVDERMFLFRWAKTPERDEWMLSEDKDSAKFAAGFDDWEEDRRWPFP
jgi:hypothetical protein